MVQRMQKGVRGMKGRGGRRVGLGGVSVDAVQNNLNSFVTVLKRLTN